MLFMLIHGYILNDTVPQKQTCFVLSYVSAWFGAVYFTYKLRYFFEYAVLDVSVSLPL